MKYIGIKLADGSFYPILEEGKAAEKLLDLTTVQDNQTTVQIDLYRSANSSMEDAEYVDTLEIKNLKPHPNGEPDLHLSVSLDEKNELNAEIKDPETGKTSETQVTLVSRTLAERSAHPVNFSIDEQEQIPTEIEEPILTDDNTLANDFVVPAEDDAAVPNIPDIDIPVTEQEVADNDDTTLSDEELASIQNTANVLNSSEENADTVKEDTEVIGPSPNSEDFSFDDLTNNSETAKKDDISPSEFDTSEFEKAVTADTFLEDEKNTDDEKTLSEQTISDSDTSAKEPTISEQDSIPDEIPASESEPVVETTGDETNIDLPDFTDISSTDSSDSSIEEKSSAEETKQLFKESDYSVPDFDQPAPIPTGLTDYFEDPTFKEPVFNETPTDNTPIDETAEKKPVDLSSDSKDSSDIASSDSESVEQKTKTPVLICIICAIICIIATVLVLFVIPSKINVIKSRNTQSKELVAEPKEPAPETAPVEQTPVEPEPVAPAVEDTVVVAPTPEVVPEQPAAPVEKPADIQYKIKWGDTLWDIADAYYKNPWRYHKLAKYNHIKNPNLIISGTTILIPAE